MSTPPTPFKKLNLDIDAAMDAVTAYSKETNVPTLVISPSKPAAPPDPEPDVSARPKKSTRLKRTAFRRVAFDLPTYLIDEISERAFKGKKSKRTIITKALKDAGFKINEQDIEDESRRER